MFTGLIQMVGKCARFESTGSQDRLVVEIPAPCERFRVGDSVCVNGCCLTVVKAAKLKGAAQLTFDLLGETLARTNLGKLRAGQRVNIESSMSAAAGFHGHFVTGHIEGTGVIQRWDNKEGDWILRVSLPKPLAPYIVHKGSVAVDGISLTVANVKKHGFEVRIIPHTRAATNLADRKIGDEVNLEPDVLAKYVEAMVDRRLRRKHRA